MDIIRKVQIGSIADPQDPGGMLWVVGIVENLGINSNWTEKWRGHHFDDAATIADRVRFAENITAPFVVEVDSPEFLPTCKSQLAPEPEITFSEVTVTCRNNLGLEDKFNVGVPYLMVKELELDMLLVLDRNGKEVEVLAERFTRDQVPSDFAVMSDNMLKTMAQAVGLSDEIVTADQSKRSWNNKVRQPQVRLVTAIKEAKLEKILLASRTCFQCAHYQRKGVGMGTCDRDETTQAELGSACGEFEARA